MLIEEKITKFVLETFNTNLFVFSEVTSLARSELTEFCKLSRLSLSKNIFVSSTNKKILNLSEILGRSLIYKRNSKGPSTDPWGTPEVKFLISEEELLRKTC